MHLSLHWQHCSAQSPDLFDLRLIFFNKLLLLLLKAIREDKKLLNLCNRILCIVFEVIPLIPNS